MISQQCLSVLDLLHAWRFFVTLDPGLQQLIDLVELFRILQMKTTVVIVVF